MTDIRWLAGGQRSRMPVRAGHHAAGVLAMREQLVPIRLEWSPSLGPCK